MRKTYLKVNMSRAFTPARIFQAGKKNSCLISKIWRISLLVCQELQLHVSGLLKVQPASQLQECNTIPDGSAEGFLYLLVLYSVTDVQQSESNDLFLSLTGLFWQTYLPLFRHLIDALSFSLLSPNSATWQ